MTARPCIYCANPVAPTVEKCPSCGGTEPFPLTQAEFGKGALLVVGIFVLLVATCVFTMWVADQRGAVPTSPTSAPRDWRETPDTMMANAMMHEFVRERLRSPRTGKFASYFDRNTEVAYLGDQKYLVRSWVDAQNAFGATVRTEYVGEIQQVSKDRWSLISLELQQP